MPQANLQTSDSNQLQHAFSVFNQLSTQLTESYQQLQAQVERLSRELSESRRQQHQRLQERDRLANRLSLVLEALPAAVVVIDGRERIDQFNPAAEALFPSIGWGRRWPEVLAEYVISQPRNDEWRLRDGRRVNVSASQLSSEPGKILVMLDVTDARALQEQIERQQRLTEMGEMAAQLAHQIRTPVSTALLYTSHLAREDLRPEQRQRFAGRMKAALQHTERQISDMLAFARGGQYSPEKIDLQQVLSDAVATVEPLLGAAGATLQVSNQLNRPALISGNANALTGVLVNLIDNALRHGGSGVAVAVCLSAVEDGYCLQVEDDGKGIAKADREHLFDPFYTTSAEGTGLGLAVVQNVVIAHGGAIRLMENKTAGAGFVICLPGLQATESLEESVGEEQ